MADTARDRTTTDDTTTDGTTTEGPFLTRLGGHLPALDGLRGLAILLVVLLHFRDYTTRPADAADRLFLQVAGAGWSGVDLFFVLSGFLITGILLDAKGAPHYFKNFYLRRALRIFPLYYAVLALHVVTLPLLEPANAPELQTLMERQGWYWAYLTNLFGALNPNGAEVYGLGHFWSLAIEEQFYFVWPLVVWLTPARRLQAVCLAAAAAAFLLRLWLNVTDAHPMVAYMLTPAHMDGLVLGALTAVEIRKRKGRALVEASWKPVAAAAMVFVLYVVYRTGGLRWESPIANVTLFTVLSVLFAAMVGAAAVAAPGSVTHRVLVNPVLRSFGKYSYAIYVFHNPLAYWFHRAGFTVADLPTVGGSHLPARLFYIVLGTALSYLAALASWHLLEKRFLALKDRFPYGRTRPSRPPSTMPVP